MMHLFFFDKSLAVPAVRLKSVEWLTYYTNYFNGLGGFFYNSLIESNFRKTDQSSSRHVLWET
jgi:hypothetical protein